MSKQTQTDTGTPGTPCSAETPVRSPSPLIPKEKRKEKVLFPFNYAIHDQEWWFLTGIQIGILIMLLVLGIVCLIK